MADQNTAPDSSLATVVNGNAFTDTGANFNPLNNSQNKKSGVSRGVMGLVILATVLATTVDIKTNPSYTEKRHGAPTAEQCESREYLSRLIDPYCTWIYK